MKNKTRRARNRTTSDNDPALVEVEEIMSYFRRVHTKKASAHIVRRFSGKFVKGHSQFQGQRASEKPRVERAGRKPFRTLATNFNSKPSEQPMIERIAGRQL